MTGWRQAVFVRQRRIDVIQRALSKILDGESWSPATPRRLHIGAADASSRGWTMIVPELANFFLDRGGLEAKTGATNGAKIEAPRLCRLACELHCPAYEVDVRNAAATTLFEADPLGRMRISGAPIYLLAGLTGPELAGPEPDARDAATTTGLGVASTAVGFGLLPVTDDIRERIAALHGGAPMALADYLGALAGFPAWTHLGDDPIAAGELVYEPLRNADRTMDRPPDHDHRSYTPLATAGLSTRRPETHGATARTTARGVPASHDRRGTRPRSAARPRR
jgi:hypothetical protein